MTLRISYLPDGSMKSWVDYETPLPSGVVSRFFIYIHNITAAQIDAQSQRIRLQIWRPVDPAVPTFMLVWQQLVVVNNFSPDGVFYSVR